MSAATYVELQDAVTFNSFDPGRYRPFVKRWINDSQRDICRRLRLGKSYRVLALTNGTAEIPFREVREVRFAKGPVTVVAGEVANQSEHTLSPIPYASGGYSGEATPGGQPELYEVYRASQSGSSNSLTLRVWPAPQGQSFVAVSGYADPTELAADSDVLGLGQEFEDAIVAFARARAFRYEDDFEAAAFWDAEYINLLRGLASVSRPNDDGPSVTPGTWGDGTRANFGGA